MEPNSINPEIPQFYVPLIRIIHYSVGVGNGKNAFHRVDSDQGRSGPSGNLSLRLLAADVGWRSVDSISFHSSTRPFMESKALRG